MGAFVVALIVSLFRMPTLTWQIFLIGFIGGLLWAIGQFGQFNSMKYMGVSVASPLSSGSQLVIGGLIGVFAFHEWTKQIQFILGFIAMAVLVVGFYFSAKRDPENAVVEEGRNYTKGLTALTYSTLGYVIYVILFNNLAVLWFNVHFDTLTIILPMSVGMIFYLRSHLPLELSRISPLAVPPLFPSDRFPIHLSTYYWRNLRALAHNTRHPSPKDARQVP